MCIWACMSISLCVCPYFFERKFAQIKASLFFEKNSSISKAVIRANSAERNRVICTDRFFCLIASTFCVCLSSRQHLSYKESVLEKNLGIKLTF